MCVVNASKNMNINFAITNLILSMKGPFTCQDVCELVEKYPFQVTEKTVLKTIIRLRENDYLEEVGHSYTVIPKEKSMRWGWN